MISWRLWIRETPLPLYESLVKHNIVIEQMLFGPHRHVFDSYLLLRKLYIFKMDQYLRVLLLDIDGVVTGLVTILLRGTSPMRQEAHRPVK